MLIKIKGLVNEDFTNYKKASMFIIFPYCTFKCNKEYGDSVCQNSRITQSSTILVDTQKIVHRYLDNPITSAVVCGGLEPMDSYEDLCNLLRCLRDYTDDDFVIYTGYTEKECNQSKWLQELSAYPNVYVKFGRYRPNEKPHLDPILGVNLASENQYAKKISTI